MRRFCSLLLVTVLLSGSASAQGQLDPALTAAPQHQTAEAALASEAPSLAARGGEADLTWRWTGDPRWMTGHATAGGETFFDSIGRGRHIFIGSSVTADGDLPVKIVFSESDTTFAQTFRRDRAYRSSGVGVFPGAAYDISDPDNPRRLNVSFVEDGNEEPVNLTWDPNSSTLGKREYLIVMASDYDGTGETYAGTNVRNDGLDVLYFWWPRLREGATLFESDPATLTLHLADITDFTALPGNGEVALSWNYTPPTEAASIVVYRGLASPASEPLDILAPSALSYSAEGLDEDVTYYFRAEALNADGDVVDLSAEVRLRPLVSRNMSLVGTLDPSDTYGDIWGYVDPITGREYALLCARNDGLYVIDVTDDAPVVTGFVAGLSDSKDIKTYGTYAYLVNEYTDLQIIDLSDPTNPIQVNTLDTGGGDGGSHNVLVEGDYLYVVGGRSPGGLRIFDLASPTAPAFVGAFAGADSSTYYHDIDIRGDTLYAAAIYDQGVDIVDISDKTAPALISTFTYAATYQGAHNVCSTEDGAYVFVGDEIGTGSWTRVFDVRDPDNVDQVAEIIVNADSPVHNCYVEGDLLYIAHYSEGIRVFDVSDPTAPVEAAIFDTYFGPSTSYVGNWTVYPYLPSGKIIASDMQSGLFVLRLDDNVVAADPDAAPSAAGFALGAGFPNPSAGTTTIPFTLAEAGRVRLVIYDVLGREVAVLVDEERPAGPHAAIFDGSNLPNGAYFSRLEVEGAATAQTQPLTLLR